MTDCNAVMEFLMKHARFWLIGHTTVIYGLTEKDENSLDLSLPSSQNHPILYQSLNAYIQKSCMLLVVDIFCFRNALSLL